MYFVEKSGSGKIMQMILIFCGFTCMIMNNIEWCGESWYNLIYKVDI
ncbi:hypothetical protein CLMAG_42630 [Clostridium magnum DSM 2767]|uniref:Uncharacterized protein n=1 Tax=Clostridium magnum DSM 2767 TaxID=1121326 RepID=A0A161YJ99_9CLOT|nr:hypothetical protein CLMAG_42630 [Clostridium magnum DSM 2767]SHH86625.1 hypothetical protein SAMN02745944_01640 [Clostridium magnum DSM 2767]